MKPLLAVVLAVLLTAGGAALWAQGLLNNSADPRQTPPPEKPATPAQPAQIGKLADEKAILECLFAYKEAFNQGDAAAIAKHFTEHAEVVDEAGATVEGRDAILKMYEGLFKTYPGAALEIHIDWFRWISGDVVVGHGKAKMTPKNGTPHSISYSAIYAKRNGQWPIVMLRESSGQPKEAKTREQSLKELDFLVGEFVDSDDSGTLKMVTKWSRNNAYLLRSFTVSSKDEVALEGTEVIGWDPSRGVLRSWVFDTNGGFAEGTWKHKDKSWYCTLAGVQSDGKKCSAVHIFTPTGGDYTFQSIGRTIDGEVQPDIDEVTVRRVVNKTGK